MVGNTFRLGLSSWNKGISYRAGIPKPWVRLAILGDKNINWRGESVGYRALHYWVENTLGKPTTCELCDAQGLVGKKIHWANKSHEYKRDVTDWVRLCAKCHKAYDAGKLNLQSH